MDGDHLTRDLTWVVMIPQEALVLMHKRLEETVKAVENEQKNFSS